MLSSYLFLMNFLRYLWLACSGFRTYRGLIELSLRSVLIYWAILSSLLAVAFVGNLAHWFKIGFPVIQKVMAHVPAFSLANGQARSPLPQPFFANTNQFPIILDLEKKLEEPQKMFPKGVLIRKKEFSFWLDDSKPILVPWKGWPDGEVNGAYLKNLENETLWALPWFFLVIWLGLGALGLIQSLVFTMLAGLLERSITPNYTFLQLYNIALFAVTPGAIIVATYVSFGLYEIQYSVLYVCCYCLFFMMASSACRPLLKPSGKDEADED